MIVQKNDVKKNVLSFPGKIHLVCSDEELKKISSELSTAKVLGFDTETRPSFVKNQTFKVALLQLSTETNAYLIRLHKISDFQNLKVIFENPNVIKVGVAIRDDIKTLRKTFNFEPHGFVELQKLAKEKALTKFGLKGMAEEILEGTVNKGPKMTNWESKTLTQRQLKYAATDAWIGLRLFEKLNTL